MDKIAGTHSLSFRSHNNLKSRIQNLKWLRVSVIVFAFAVTGAGAQAQQQAKNFKIGYLSAQTDLPGRRGGARELIRHHLDALGYVERRNIVFEYRFADNKLDLLASLANDLIRQHVDLIIATSNSAALAAKNATKTIPIVFLGGGDPVAIGLVASLAHPKENITGVASMAEVLAGKRLELIKETIPGLSRVAILWNPRGLASVQQWNESQLPARGLGLRLYSMQVSSIDTLKKAFEDAMKSRSTALVGTHESLFTTHRKRIVDLAVQTRLPAIYPREDFVDSGGLMSYGADRAEPYRRAASMIDKILKGANPADLPVERSTKIELVVNLKTAEQIGLTIPPNILARADRVIR